MSRARLLALLALASACGPSPVARVDAGSPEQPHDDLPRGVVWGVAELHAHPAIHLAFAGGEDGTGGAIWGHPGVVPHPSGVVPAQPSCDAETHLVSSPDQVQRATRALVFRLLSAVNSFPHSPYAGDRFALAGGPGHVSTQSSWPHGRDLFHQQMHIEAIRRAYEGGLRLMIASATDNRTLSLFFRAPVFPGPPSFRREEDRESAERQIAFIHDVVSRNADWMEIVTSPEQARTAIEEGRLAIVISLEMDALSIEDVEYFYDRWGARHIVPIHLADNDVGGTAAFNDLFNSHSALQSVLLGAPTPRYVAVEPSERVRYRYAWLLRIGAGIANFEPASLLYEDYGPLGYEPLPLCSGQEPGVAWGFGHRNAMGLRDAGYLQRLMQLGMMLDVAHMGERALEETFRITDGCALCGDSENVGYPLMDSHTGLFPDHERRPHERDISVAQARRIVRSGGVIGYGTAGEHGHFEGTELRPPETLFRAVGGPLASFGRDDRKVFRNRAAEGSCMVEEAQSAAAGDLTLCVPAPPSGRGWVRIEPCDPARPGRTALDPAIVPLPAPDCIEVPEGTRSITVGWLEPELCRTVDEGQWRVPGDAIRLQAGDAVLPLAGRPSSTRCSSRGEGRDDWFELDAHRPSFTIATFSCEDRLEGDYGEPPYCTRCGRPPGRDGGAAPDAGAPDAGVEGGVVEGGGTTGAPRGLCDPFDAPEHEPDPVRERAGVLRVTVRSAASADDGAQNTLRGATSTYVGSEVCARFVHGGAEPLAHVTQWLRGGCPAPEGEEEPWFSLNRGATWGGGVSFAQYVLVAPGRAAEIEGVELMVTAYDGRWTRDWLIDEIVVEDVGDPVLSWARFYAARLHDVYGAEPHADPLAAFALGTDINGLAPQFAISSCHPGDADSPFDCEGAGEVRVDHDADPSTPPLRVPRPPDLRFRTADGGIVRMRFDERGMGGFGMIPDLLQLVSDYGQQQTLDALFRSAEATIRMWERIERWRRGHGCDAP